MTRLWKALCGDGGNATDETKLIREYFTPILEGNLPSLTSRHWRDRLSACLALDDLLLVGRSAAEVLPFVRRLWEGEWRVDHVYRRFMELFPCIELFPLIELFPCVRCVCCVHLVREQPP